MEATKKHKYPIGYWICCLTYTFERFAFYGSKPLLVLFLTAAVSEGGLGISEVDAAPIAALLTSLTYLAPIAGGWICDRWLGARYAVTLGCILMGLGYFIGWKSTSVAMVYGMIVVVSIGTAFFKGNLAAIIGRLFDDKELLDSAFSIQYSFVNIGSFFGSMICGVLYMNQFAKGEVLGFRQVFLLCGILVIVGGIFFTLCYGLLQGQGKLPFKYLTDTQGNVVGEEKHEKQEKSTAPLTVVEKNHVIAIILVSLFSVIFWLAYYQQDIFLTFYIQNKVMRNIGSFELSPVHLTTTWNGLLCIFLSLAFAKLWTILAKRPQGDLSMFHKVTLSFVFLGLSYGTLMIMEILRGVGAPNSTKAHFIWIALFGVFITIGEICFSPLGNSFVSKFAPKKYLALLMGIWTAATFLASTINGQIMKLVEKLGDFNIMVAFTIISFACAIAMFLLIKPLNKLTEEE